MTNISKTLIFLFFLPFTLMNFSDKADQIEVTCKMVGCKTELFLYQFDGLKFTKTTVAQFDSADTYTFKIPKTVPQFYYLGEANFKRLSPIILGAEDHVDINGRCPELPNLLSIDNSPLNNAYIYLKKDIREMQRQQSSLIRKYQRSKTAEERELVVADFKALDDFRLNLLDSLKSTNPYLGKILALNTYLSFQANEDKDQFGSEIDYFAQKYFQFVDFEDDTYNRLPWIYESFRSYAQTMGRANVPTEKHKAYLQATLERIPKGSQAYKYALCAYISSMQNTHPNFVYFGEHFIELYQDKDPQAAQEIKNQVERIKNYVIGGEAPDFTQKTPEGEELSLSELRGKVVLVDFWASWCGPCRKENPNVVKLYEKYKEKGFEILGVSLDKKKEPWLAAIKKDGLGWKHVSDLKGWKNEVALDYGVRSIPHTILLDKEGKIIAKKLRGPVLEKKLEQIFGF